jgi:hypothetical protein
MLSFTLNNEPLVLSHDTSVQLVWQNPACNFKDFPGDVGLGIDIPVNDHNRMLLGNPERFDRYATENKRELPDFEITYSGVLLMRGTLVIESADNKTYSGWLRSEAGNIGKVHREKFITDSISFNEEKTFENKSSYDPDTDPYACPIIYNPTFFKDKGQYVLGKRKRENPNYGKKVFRRTNFLGWGWVTDNEQYETYEVNSEDLTEAFLYTANWRVNQRNEYLNILAPDTNSRSDAESIRNLLKVAVVSPMLFLHYVLKTIFKDAGFAVRENFLKENEDLKKLVLYHNFDITRIEHIPANAMPWEVYYFDGTEEDVYQLAELNKMAIGNLVTRVHRYVDKFTFKECLPQMELKEFVMGIQNLLNVFIHFVPGRKMIDIIDREGLLDEEAIDIEAYLTGEWKINEKLNNELKFSFEHDSNDMLISERWNDIEEYRIKEKEPVNTWDDLQNIENPEMDEIRFVRDKNIYAQYKLWLLEAEDQEEEGITQDKYIGWRHLSIAWQNGFFNFGQEEQEEIDTKFSTLVDSGQAGTRQKGNIRSDLFAWESFGPRLLFAEPSGAGSYETGNISIDWEKEGTGLLQTRWKYWKRIWATRQEVSTEAHFHLNILDHVINNIYRKFRGQEGEFIIEEMKTEFRMNEIGKTQIKGYKFDYAPRSWELNDMWQIDDVIWFDEWVDMTGLEQYYPLVVNW